MKIEFSVHSAPPSAVFLENERKRIDRSQNVSVLAIVAAIALFGIACYERHEVVAPPVWTGWLMFLCVVAVVIFTYKYMQYTRDMRPLLESGPPTLEAMLCSDVPPVVAYCKAVKAQERMLTMDEAEALMTLCTSDDALNKIAASYDRYDEEHPYRAVHY